MRSIKSIVILFAVALLVAVAFFVRATRTAEQQTTPQSESISSAPTFVELGSDRCRSCKAMIPGLDELRSTHGCNLNVRFVDVWDNPSEGERFDVTAIHSLLRTATS